VARPVEWVVFDLGETLIDETANWDRWAEHLGVPRFTFHAVLGAMIAAGRPHLDLLTYFRSDLDVEAEIAAKDASGLGWSMTAADLYDDAIPTMQLLREQGYRLAVFANQPSQAAQFMAGLPADHVATSEQWGLWKPDPSFFERVAATLGARPRDIAYVGDRVDNDVVPSKRAGMLAVHLRRGPWGFLQAEWPGAAEADVRIDSLTELPAALAAVSARSESR
jgi:HAD superfamily hydrolase (TIGR01549 family)